MFGLDLRSPHRRATSSGSINLNSPFEPSQAITLALALASASSSRRNCHNWIWPVPKQWRDSTAHRTRERERDFTRSSPAESMSIVGKERLTGERRVRIWKEMDSPSDSPRLSPVPLKAFGDSALTKDDQDDDCCCCCCWPALLLESLFPCPRDDPLS